MDVFYFAKTTALLLLWLLLLIWINTVFILGKIILKNHSALTFHRSKTPKLYCERIRKLEYKNNGRKKIKEKNVIAGVGDCREWDWCSDSLNKLDCNTLLNDIRLGFFEVTCFRIFAITFATSLKFTMTVDFNANRLQV